MASADIGALYDEQILFLLSARSHASASGIIANVGKDTCSAFGIELDFAARQRQSRFAGSLQETSRLLVEKPWRRSLPFAEDGQIQFAMTPDGHNLDTILDTTNSQSYFSRRIAHGKQALTVSFERLDHGCGHLCQTVAVAFG